MPDENEEPNDGDGYHDEISLDHHDIKIRNADLPLDYIQHSHVSN